MFLFLLKWINISNTPVYTQIFASARMIQANFLQMTLILVELGHTTQRYGPRPSGPLESTFLHCRSDYGTRWGHGAQCMHVISICAYISHGWGLFGCHVSIIAFLEPIKAIFNPLRTSNYNERGCLATHKCGSGGGKSSIYSTKCLQQHYIEGIYILR